MYMSHHLLVHNEIDRHSCWFSRLRIDFQLIASVIELSASLSFPQVMGTAMLIVLVMGIGDERNMRVPHGLVPLYAGLGLMAVILGFGYHGGAGINPARDLSP